MWGSWACAAGAVALVLAISGCSGSDQPATPAGSEAVSPSASAAAGGAAGQLGKGTDQYSSKQVLPRDTDAGAAYDLQTGTAATKRRFEPLVGSLNGVRAKVAYYRAATGSSPAADIAVFTFPAAQAKSASFQNLIVSQLVITASGSTKVVFDTVEGRTFTVAGSKQKVVGAFDDNSAIVVMGQPGGKSLAYASGATFAYLNRK